MKFYSPQSCSTRENFTAMNLSTSEQGKYTYMLEVALTMGRISENFASCFPGCRYQAAADHWENFSYFPVMLRTGVSQKKFLLDVLTSL